MPRTSATRSVKSIVLETTIIVITVFLVGHLSVNFWERFLIQSELSQMKQSLHVLKKTLLNMGSAYDTLHTEMSGLQFTKTNYLLNIMSDCNDPLDVRRLQDCQVNTVYDANTGNINYPLKPADKSVNCPSGIMNAKKTLNAINQANLNTLSKINAKNEAHNFPSKADVTTAKACSVKTKNAALQPSQVKFAVNTMTMTRDPVKSTVADQNIHENRLFNKKYVVYCNKDTCGKH